MDAIRFLLGNGDTADAARAMIVAVAMIGWMWWRVGLDLLGRIEDR